MSARSVWNRASFVCLSVVLLACGETTAPTLRMAARAAPHVSHPVITPTLAAWNPADATLRDRALTGSSPNRSSTKISPKSSRPAGLRGDAARGGSAQGTGGSPASPNHMLAPTGTDDPPPDPTAGTGTGGSGGAGYAVIKSVGLRIDLPIGTDRATLPAGLVMQMSYYGDNSSQEASYLANPIGGNGVGRDGETGAIVTPGSPQCLLTYACHDFQRYNYLPIYGIGCGYDVSGTSTHTAWAEKYSTSSYSMPVRYGTVSQMATASASGDDCPVTTSSTCTGGDSGQPADGGTTVGNDYDRALKLRPLFDCEGGGGGTGATLRQVCVTYITGYYYPDTDTYEITGEWTDCWFEWESNAMTDRIAAGGLSLSATTNQTADAASVGSGVAAAKAGGRVPITLVGTGAIPGGEPTRIVRRRGGEIRDAILVDLGKATDIDLASAIAGYLAMRGDQGDTLTRDIEGVVTVSNLGREWQTNERPAVHAQLEALRNAPERTIAGIGRGHALTITTPMPRVWRQTRGH